MTDEVTAALLRLEAWLETMRVESGPAGMRGYGGPVVHWWRDNLLFCSPALDWRYEGIIHGYLALSQRTGREEWLARARRAADDAVSGQLPDGTFRNSGFELNPGGGGTPHEPALDGALLRLARVLRDAGDESWRDYFEAARRNIEGFIVGRLWRADERVFGDGGRWFVPNKAATIVETLAAWCRLTGSDEYAQRFVRPTADAILGLQVRRSGDPTDGAIAQSRLGGRVTDHYFPYYIARTLTGLLAAADLLDEDRFRDAAVAATRCLLRWRDADGALPQVVYPGGRMNRYPRWVAPTGDVIRALAAIRPLLPEADPAPSLRWLLAGQTPAGSFRCADGFASIVSQRPSPGPPDARDLLPVAGWNDKCFRALAEIAAFAEPHAGPAAAEPHAGPAAVVTTEQPCLWYGTLALYREDAAAAAVTGPPDRVLFRWVKGTSWATIG